MAASAAVNVNNDNLGIISISIGVASYRNNEKKDHNYRVHAIDRRSNIAALYHKCSVAGAAFRAFAADIPVRRTRLRHSPSYRR